MSFELIHVLSKIQDLYKLPRTQVRFERYLHLIQGADKNDIVLPIASFNPMGKELASEKLDQLIELGAEQIVEDILKTFNTTKKVSPTIQLAINLADDVDGAWSDHATTDYKSKFEIESLIKRNFCVPIFWTSEDLSLDIIDQRVNEYIYRTIFWLENGKPITLKEIFEQEVYVQSNLKNDSTELAQEEINEIKIFLMKYSSFEDYNLKFNFFYGDEASELLNYKKFGMIKNAGFKYSKYIAQKRQTN